MSGFDGEGDEGKRRKSYSNPKLETIPELGFLSSTTDPRGGMVARGLGLQRSESVKPQKFKKDLDKVHELNNAEEKNSSAAPPKPILYRDRSMQSAPPKSFANPMEEEQKRLSKLGVRFPDTTPDQNQSNPSKKGPRPSTSSV